jgi:thiosulfate/3-mercaptopyruvate sulfurtransferase
MIASAALLLVLASATAAAAPPTIVPLAWLQSHLNDPSVAIIDAGGDPESFARGHIPGAGVLNHMATLRDGHRPVDPAALARIFAAAGARDDAHIVLYGEDAMSVGWMYGLFASIGHLDHVSVLDGNLAAWRAAKYPVASGPAAPAHGALSARTPSSPLVVDGRWVRQHLDDAKFRLADVRSEDEWKRGMIPGAVKMHWQEFYADKELGRLKPPAELRQVFERAGITNQTVVTYCAVGMRASLAYLAARTAGLPVLLYQGSMNDWESRPGYPLKR